MAKFSFYFGYWDLLGKLSSRQFKKIVRALSEYAEIGTIPAYLPKKSFILFMDIKRVIDAEKEQEEQETDEISLLKKEIYELKQEAKKQQELKEKRSKAGKKGMLHRWG